MELVYGFIRDAPQDRSNLGLPPNIPQMCFIKSGLVVLDNEEHDTYMIEEVIEDTDGKFIKYIGNRSAVPHAFKDPELTNRALFFCFAQHVQYCKTKEMVFIGDFQGRLHCPSMFIMILTFQLS